MSKVGSEICLKLKEARHQAKLSQTEVAAEVGCKQSALSMFEQGDGTKLNDEVVERLAKKFGVSLVEPPAPRQVSAPSVFAPASEIRTRGFCPNAHCPSNRIYEVDGRSFARPDRLAADPVGGRFCALCGEVLEKRCPNCGAPLHDGAVCSFCGDPYVAL